MFTVLNRLRGMNGVWSKFNGLLLAYIIYSVSHNHYVALAVGIGYVIGESFGWGEWVGTLTGDRSIKQLNEEGANNGIQWLASKVVSPTKDWLNYCRVALTIRGLYWWLPTLAPLYFVGFSVESLAIAIILLSVGFPLACELGYRTSKMFEFNKYGFSVVGGWEHQEVWYGLMQDSVLILLIVYICQ